VPGKKEDRPFRTMRQELVTCPICKHVMVKGEHCPNCEFPEMVASD